MNRRPDSSEYDKEFKDYIDLIEEDNIITVLKAQHNDTQNLIAFMSEEQAEVPYKDGKWSIKELLGHVIDTERVMIYRALCFSRGEGRDLPHFDPELWVKNGKFNNRTLPDLMHKFRMLRLSNIAFYETLDEEALSRVGRSDGNLMSVRALYYYIAGHEKHHITFIKKKYFL